MSDYFYMIYGAAAIIAITIYFINRRSSRLDREAAEADRESAGLHNRIAQRLSRITSRHESDKVVKVVITDPCEGEAARKEIGRLSEGSPVWISRNGNNADHQLTVYSGGFCIGSISREVGSAVDSLIGDDTVRGSYVDRIEYCDGEPLLTLVVYFSPAAESAQGNRSRRRRTSFVECGEMHFCQN